MTRRIISEGLAKAAIYLLFIVTVFAFLFFWFDAHSYSAASPDSGAVVQNLSAQTDVVTNDTTPAARIILSGEAEAKAPVADQSGEALAAWDAWLSGIQDAVEADGGRLMDSEAVDAELDRLAAIGHTVPEAQPEYLGEFYATAYCCEEYKHICGGNGVTASGTVPTQGLTVASDWSVLPPGTWIYIEDVGVRRVEDSGSAIKQNRLDIAVDTHDSALRWGGLGNHNVWVLAWAEKD